MKVLLVDGPGAGQVVEVGTASAFYMYQPYEPSIKEFSTDEVTYEFPKQVVYHFVRWALGESYIVTIGTIKPDKPDHEDLIKHLLSDKAIEAMRRWN